jgi:hypothetical protein
LRTERAKADAGQAQPGIALGLADQVARVRLQGRQGGQQDDVPLERRQAEGLGQVVGARGLGLDRGLRLGRRALCGVAGGGGHQRLDAAQRRLQGRDAAGHGIVTSGPMIWR